MSLSDDLIGFRGGRIIIVRDILSEVHLTLTSPESIHVCFSHAVTEAEDYIQIY